MNTLITDVTEAIQTLLKSIGYYNYPINGVWGPLTYQGYAQWCADRALPAHPQPAYVDDLHSSFKELLLPYIEGTEGTEAVVPVIGSGQPPVDPPPQVPVIGSAAQVPPTEGLTSETVSSEQGKGNDNEDDQPQGPKADESDESDSSDDESPEDK